MLLLLLRPLMLLLLLLCLPTPAAADDREVVIGVLAHRGEASSYERWAPTAAYLSEKIPGYRFRLQSLDWADVFPTAAADEVDFFIVNANTYVELEYRFGASRMLTLGNRYHDRGFTMFGGVIITRRDHPAIQVLKDLPGHSFAAADRTSMGGFMTVWRELQAEGIDPERDFKPLSFVGTHEGVVHAVRAGWADAGSVRTDTLERMLSLGLIAPRELRVINPLEYPEFPFWVSTRLYPEWALAKARNTPDNLSDRVVMALLELKPDHEAALIGQYTGWTGPLNYEPVHEMMRELRVGPYEGLGVITLRQVLVQYWTILLLAAALLLFLALSTFWYRRLNRQLEISDQALREARDSLEIRVKERTADLQKANIELEESRRRIEMAHRDWNDAFDAIQNPIFIHDRNLRIVQVNPAYVKQAGLPREDLIGRLYYEVFPKQAEPLESCLSFPEEEPHHKGEEVVLPDGQILVSRSFGIRRADGSYRHAIHIIEDLTELRRSARELQRLNRALRTISRGNEVLVRATDESQLLNEVCRILVETGGYQMAWVGYVGEDEARGVRPVTHVGHEEGFLEAIPTTWADAPHGRGPTGAAIRRRQPVTCRDLQADPDFAPWCEQAVARGYASVISLPLADGDELFGALTIYAAEPDAFDTHEVVLLSELAEDLAFGIHMLRIRAEREIAVHELAASEARFQELFEHAPAGYLLVRQNDGAIIKVNEAAVQMLGYSRDEMVKTSLFSLFTPDEFGLARAKTLFRLLGDGLRLKDQELLMRRHNGKTIWISLTAEQVQGEESQVVEWRASILDISKRKEAEQERRQLSERLQRSLVQTIQAIATTIEKRDPYTAGHQQRVAELAVAIAREMGLPEKRIEGLRLGAMIHDIGKIYVPAELLNRPGELGQLEADFMRTHPEVGYEIMSGVDFPWPVAEMVLQHHERLDGSGYPKGLQGDEIIIEARIIAVADVVEAITNHRPYRPAMRLDKAIEEIDRHKNSHFDANAVDACLRLFNQHRFQWPGAWCIIKPGETDSES